jgi:hypothetical protein
MLWIYTAPCYVCTCARGCVYVVIGVFKHVSFSPYQLWTILPNVTQYERIPIGEHTNALSFIFQKSVMTTWRTSNHLRREHLATYYFLVIEWCIIVGFGKIRSLFEGNIRCGFKMQHCVQTVSFNVKAVDRLHIHARTLTLSHTTHAPWHTHTYTHNSPVFENINSKN